MHVVIVVSIFEAMNSISLGMFNGILVTLVYHMKVYKGVVVSLEYPPLNWV